MQDKKLISMYESYLNKYETKALQEMDLYYAFLKLPDFWEIQPEKHNGAIYNRGIKLATIYFKPPIEKRNVQRIEWCTEDNQIYKIDYYNRYGFAYCSEYMDEDKKVHSKVYYTSVHMEVIHINYTNNIVTLFENGNVIAIFESLTEFEAYLMKM